MRVIINDTRYAALKTLVERKQAFKEVSVTWTNFLQLFLFIAWSDYAYL